MACYHPLKAFQLDDGTIVFAERSGHGSFRDLELPCGRCIGCRLERSRQWSVRIMQEASLYDFNVFITLTYSDEHLPGPSLVYRDFQLFMKRLRFARPGTKVRFFASGEYGGLTNRPHFHAILFNCWFPDRRDFGVGSNGAPQWTSEELEKLWGLGMCVIAGVTFQSAGYVARYCLKKVYGEPAEDHYKRIDPISGREIQIAPEFMKCSQGIGRAWLEKHWESVYGNASPGMIVQDGHLGKTPRYYDKVLKERDPDLHAAIAFDRMQVMLRQAANNTDERLAVREEVKERQANMLIRKL